MMLANTLVRSCYARFYLLSENAVNFENHTDSQFHPLIENAMYVQKTSKFWTHNRAYSMSRLNESIAMRLGFSNLVQRMHFLKNKTESFIVQVELKKNSKTIQPV